VEIEDALKIVRALANGKNPQTEEMLEAGSVCRQPLTVKALNRAISALVDAQARQSSRPINAFRAWTRAEDAQVCEELRQGKDFHEIAKAHNRTVPSIVARLVKLGEIAPKPISKPTPNQAA